MQETQLVKISCQKVILLDVSGDPAQLNNCQSALDVSDTIQLISTSKHASSMTFHYSVSDQSISVQC